MLHGHRPVSMATTPGGGDSNRSLHTRGPCLTPHAPATAAGSSPVQREPQEVESGRTFAPLLPSRRSPKRQHTGLVRMQCESVASQPLGQDIHHALRVVASLEADHTSSRPGESHPQALTEPDMNVSAHPALTVQPLLDATSASGQRAPGRRPRWPVSGAPSAGDAAASVCISLPPNGPTVPMDSTDRSTSATPG